MNRNGRKASKRNASQRYFLVFFAPFAPFAVRNNTTMG
jgi:hypothetical protein